MKRILLMVIRNILRVPMLAIQLFWHSANVNRYTEKEHYAFFKKIVGYANRGGNVQIKAFGTENIPKESGFMLFPNHQGMYDVLALYEVCALPLSVVTKKEVKDVPFLKQIFKCMKAFAMDRDDVRQSMKVIIDVSKEVEKGRNYIIFPEGTRSKNGNQLGEFKAGSFKAATKAKCPIVPVALVDSFKPFDTNSIKPVTVQVHILKPLLYEDYKDMKSVEIAEEVKNRIQHVITENS